MLWLWVLGGIALLFLLFCLTPLGIRVKLGKTAAADIMVGPMRFRVAPSKPRKKKKKKAPEKKEPSVVIKKRKKLPIPSPEDLLSAAQELWTPCRRALRRTRRGIRVNPLRLSILMGGADDPALAAETYGKANAAVWAAMPVLEQLLVIPDPRIHLGVDFENEKTKVRGEAGVSLRIGTMIAVGLGVGIPAIRWFLRYRKKERKKKEEEPARTDAA